MLILMNYETIKYQIFAKKKYFLKIFHNFRIKYPKVFIKISMLI